MPKWYNEGLQFGCTQCGNCCHGWPAYVFVTPEEIDRIKQHTGKGFPTIEDEHGVSLTKKKGEDCCFFFEQGVGCTIHEVKPTQCRTWPFWSSNVKSRKAWDKAANGCPGMNQGQLISVEEITRKVKEIDL